MIPVKTMCPAVGQGALAIETRNDGGIAQQFAGALNHAPTQTAVTAERALLAKLEGGCQVPIGAHATVDGRKLHLTSIVASPDGSRLIRGSAWGRAAVATGTMLADALLESGAGEILNAVYSR
jgi:hydroxymethylbilane synthase